MRPRKTAEDRLHDLRGDAHRVFDSWWMRKKMSRTTAYTWIMVKMSLPRDKAHISLFDANQCIRLIKLVEEADAGNN